MAVASVEHFLDSRFRGNDDWLDIIGFHQEAPYSSVWM